MLSRSSKINRSSLIQSPGSVQALENYINRLQAPPVFPSIGNEHTDKKKNGHNEQQDEQIQQKDSELELIMPRKDFQEMFSSFFVLGHKKLLIIQAKIRRERGIKRTSILSLRNIDDSEVQTLRRQYYQLQVLLFKMSKGDNHSSSI